MTKVITYGTYDLLHFGHIRLLERAKELGDYLIVGVTSDDFDKSRGKINVQQSLTERMEAVRATGLADEIIVEEYEGQKIDDIKKYDVDIFTVGSDWVGYFDYLNEFCNVVYLDRTQGVSSTEIRAESSSIELGLVGNYTYLNKFLRECKYVNGVNVKGIFTTDQTNLNQDVLSLDLVTKDYQALLDSVDAVYIHSYPGVHYEQVKQALLCGKHVMCESPVGLSKEQYTELCELAAEKKLILMDSIRTAYSTAFQRLVLMLKGGKIGKIISVDATCTSLKELDKESYQNEWNSITAWGPTALLPVFELLGTDYKEHRIASHYADKENRFDSFSKIDLLFEEAVASVKVGYGVKSEGELVVSGTKGYAYVPAPWWKTDYFELRFENAEDTKRYFYQLDGEGIRYEVVAFVKAIKSGRPNLNIAEKKSMAIVEMMEHYYNNNHVVEI